MSPPPLVLGVALLAAATLLLADAARRVAVRLCAGDLLATVAASAVLMGAAIVVLLELLGLAGLLDAWAPAAASGVTWLAARRSADGAVVRPSWPRPAGVREWPRPALVAAGAAAVLAVPLAAQLLAALIRPHPTFDTQAGHLNTVVDWLQAGDLRFLPYASPIAAQPRYPADSELQGLWFVLPLHRDLFVQAANLLWAAMLASGAALAVRELGGRVSGAAAAALAPLTVPIVLWPLVGTNMTDLLLGGGLAAACGFCALGARTGSGSAFVLAGLSAGMVAGSRYAGIIALAPLALVALVAVAEHRPHPSREVVLRGAGLAAGAVLLTGVYWYVRNWALTGDPIYPQSVPWDHVDSPELDPFRLFASYAQLGLDPHAWGVLAGEIWTRGGPLLTLLVVGVAGPPLVLAWRRERRVLAWTWCLLPALELVGFLATPLSAGYLVDGQPVAAGADLNLRYLLPTMVTSAIVLAGFAGRLPAGRADLAAAGAMALGVIGLLVVGTPPASVDYPGATLLLVAAAGIALVVAAVAGGAPQLAALDAAVRRPVVPALLAITVAAAVSPAVQRYHDNRRSALAFDDAAALLPQSGTVDVAGFCEIYALYGPELERRVTYLTGDDSAISRRTYTTYDRWLASLRAHDTALVVTGSDICFPPRNAPQVQWISQHPEVFSRVTGDRSVTVWRVAAAAPSASATG